MPEITTGAEAVAVARAPGSGPVIVFKADGETAYLGSAPLQVQLERIKQMRGIVS